MYIAFEGIVGSGKTTQVKNLVEYFRSLGKDVTQVREPGTTVIAEDIRHLAQGKEWENEIMHPLTNAYLYAAARAQTLETVVKPALERGEIVISDRCFLSSCAIQGEAQGLGINRVLWVNKTAVGKIFPDMILYLDIDIERALARTFDEGGDKFEREGKDFYKKIIRGYEKISKWKKLESKFIRINADGNEEEVFQEIIHHINKFLGL
ncbi:MAG: dTMP kinase [Candidatus Altimarinota bacterium]